MASRPSNGLFTSAPEKLKRDKIYLYGQALLCGKIDRTFLVYGLPTDSFFLFLDGCRITKP